MLQDMQEKEKCPLCQRAGLIKYLKSYQINLDEAIVLCENKFCTYPLSQSSSVAATFSRKFDDVVSSRASEVKVKVPDSQLALQTKVASLIHRTGLKLQNGAVGTQTGSPQLKKKLKKSHLPNKKRGTTASILSQTGLNSYPPFQLQNGSQSFQTFKSFTETNGNTPGATEGQKWTGCSRSQGISDRDSLLNSSGDSLESSSVTSSNSSLVDNLTFPNKASKSFEGFKFKGSQTQHLPNSLPNLSSLNITYSGHSDIVKGSVMCDKEGTADQECHKTSIKLSDDNENTVQETSRNSPIQTKLETDPSCQVNNKDSDDEVRESHKMQTFDEPRNRAVDNHDYLLKNPLVFPQWRNKDALCWLDVILCLAVHNETLKSLVFSDSYHKKSLIHKLFKAHNQACKLIQECNSKPEIQEHDVNGTKFVQTVDYLSSNAENRTQTSNGLTEKNNSSCSVKDSAYSENLRVAETLLNNVREEMWDSLKNKLKCKKGQNESPVFAFPLLLKEDHAVEEMFKMTYRFDYKCSKCGNVENSDHLSTLPTFPCVVKDFNIGDPKHSKKCQKCGNTEDTRNMVYKNLPESMLMHFTEGLPDTSFEELQFGFHGYLYTVTGLVQYVNSPDHFIAWLRNPHDNKWFKCDDLGPTVCRKRIKVPEFPCSQIHIVMWERLNRKSKIYSQVAAEKDNRLPAEAQRSEKKAMLNLDFSALPGIDTPHPKVMNGSALKTLKDIGKYNEDKVKCFNTSVKVLDSSPCSTLSAGSSDSLLLPNFVAFTTESENVLRPIPVSYVNAIPEGSNTSEINKIPAPPETKLDNDFERSDKKQGLTVENISEIDSSKSELGESGNDTSENMVGKCPSNILSSKIRGPKSVIKPSTVFCVPKKSREVDNNLPPSIELKTGNVEITETSGKEMYSVGGTPTQQCTRMRTRSSVKESNAAGSSDQALFGNCKNLDKDGNNVDKNGVSENNEGVKTVNKQKSTSRLGQSSRFKVPFKLNRKACLSRDAFVTLEINGKSRPGSSASDTPVSTTSSPAFSGNLTFLNSVKQYLLSRTTGRADPKFKFEGLNLKSTSGDSSLNLSGFGLPISSSASSIQSEVPSECNSPSNSSDTVSMSNSSKTSELVNELIQKLEQSPLNHSTLKRKVDSSMNKSPKKRVKESHIEEDTMSNGNASLKENDAKIHNQRKLPGGKSMRLVRKLVNKAEKVNNEEIGSKTKEEHLELNNQMLNTKSTKCDSETVLQDLYEALNIPFSSVDATMTDIMTDVGDILDFVNVDELVPGQHHVNRPPSCFEGSSVVNQKHCWLRRPDCSSTQREMSYFRITHLFLK